MPDKSELIDLWNLDYMFAVSDIDPRVGRILVTQTSWDFSGEESKKVPTPIKMVDCEEYNENGSLAHVDLGNKRKLLEGLALRRNSDTTFLCPSDIDEMLIRGNFANKFFDYIKI